MINYQRPNRWSLPRPILTAAIILMVAANLHAQTPRPGRSEFPAELTTDRIQSTLLEVRLAERAPGPGLQPATIQDSGERIYLHDVPVITNNDVMGARVIENDGHISIAIRFSSQGAAKMATATSGHIGRPLAIIINGRVVTAPNVRDPIADDAVISGDFTRAEAERIASGLQR